MLRPTQRPASGNAVLVTLVAALLVTSAHAAACAVQLATDAPPAVAPSASAPAAGESPAADDPPPAPRAAALPFSTLSFDEARLQASSEGRLFIVTASTAWCGACREMERTAWVAQTVLAWLAEHAVVVSVDIQAQKGLARELELDEAPVILVLRGETELDRRAGAQDAADLLAWLGDAERGGDGTGPRLFKALKLLQSDDIDARRDIARDLLWHGENELALQHYLWLWPNSRRSVGMGGVRLSFLLSEMKRLADRDEDARQAFEEVYADVHAAVADITHPALWPWLEFAAWCRDFEHEDDLLAWYAAHKEPDGSVASDAAAATLFDLFVEGGDWAAAGRTGRLVERASRQVGTGTVMTMSMKLVPDSDIRSDLKDFQAEQLRKDLSRMSAAAWAAGLEDDGAVIARKLLRELDDAPTRLALVGTTLAAVGARAQQGVWLDEAAALGADAKRIAELREQLAEAIASVPPGAAAPVAPASAPEPLR